MPHLAEIILVGSKYSVWVRPMKTNSCFWNAWKDICTHLGTTATGLGKTPAIYSHSHILITYRLLEHIIYIDYIVDIFHYSYGR